MKRLLLVLSAVTVCSLMLAAAKNEYARLFTEGASFGMQALISEYKSEEDGGVTLFLGSSVFRQGLEINVIEESFRKDVYVLSYNGNQPYMEYLVLDYLVENDVHIAHLYVDMYAMSLTATPGLSDEKILIETDTAFKTALWDQIRPYQERVASSAGHYFIRANNELIVCWPFLSPFINRRFHHGGNMAGAKGTTADALDEMQYDIMREYHPAQRDAIENMIDLCEREGIRICFIEVPKWHTIHENQNYLEVMSYYAGLLADRNVPFFLTDYTRNALLGNVSDIVIPPDKGILFDINNADYYQDGVHLSSEGRKVYTQALMQRLAE